MPALLNLAERSRRHTSNSIHAAAATNTIPINNTTVPSSTRV